MEGIIIGKHIGNHFTGPITGIVFTDFDNRNRFRSRSKQFPKIFPGFQCCFKGRNVLSIKIIDGDPFSKFLIKETDLLEEHNWFFFFRPISLDQWHKLYRFTHNTADPINFRIQKEHLLVELVHLLFHLFFFRIDKLHFIRIFRFQFLFDPFQFFFFFFLQVFQFPLFIIDFFLFILDTVFYFIFAYGIFSDKGKF